MRAILLVMIMVICLACGGGGGDSGSVDLRQEPSVMHNEETNSLEQNMVSFKPVGSSAWDETKVRKVLHTFALGSQVSDEKISIWAKMSNEDAIDEILSLNVFNTHFQSSAMSVYIAGELTSLAELWSLEKDSKGNSKVTTFGLDSWNGPAEVWLRAILDPNLNPVRQRIGLFETNDHMAVNLEANVESRQIFKYYDDILTSLAKGMSYEEVLSVAAGSAAIAIQYNHKDNRFVEGMFMGNEDFAREFHQLFFGILGVADPDYHEKVTIRNTAKALTDMKVNRDTKANGYHLLTEVTYGQAEHYPGDLNILNTMVSGNTAKEKLSKMADLAINETESLTNLPLKIIQGLSDPLPSEKRKTAIAAAWQANQNKSLLAFLRRYAISDAFHHEERFRFWTTLERLTILDQRMKTSEKDVVFGNFISAWELMQVDSAPFRPYHDVFGSMQGEEAAQTSEHFRMAWDLSTRQIWRFVQYEKDGIKRDWSQVLAPDDDGHYPVKYVAEWLWQRFIADGLKNFGLLERSQVYALLASGLDYQVFSDPEQAFAIISSDDLLTDHHQELLNDLSITRMQFISDEVNQRKKANERVGLAIAFIAVTPYMFAQEGK